MIFPGSRIWYEGSAIDLSALTEEIKDSGFSGHLFLDFHDSLDLVIIAEGNFLKVIEKIGQRLMSTKKYREIWGKCQIKPGRMVIFELPPPLARRLRGMSNRRLICSGRLGDMCDLEKTIRDQKAARLNGFLDCVAPEGKGLLEFEGGTITACYYTEYQGLSYTGLEGFRKLHQGLVRSEQTSFTFISEYIPGTDNSHIWDEILIDNVENIQGSIRTLQERLFAAFGQTVHEGDFLFKEGQPTSKVYLLLEGSVELSRKSGKSREIVGILTKGEILGLSWLFYPRPPSLTCQAVEECHLLAFDQTQLEHLVYNSPPLAAQLVRKLACLIQGVYRRLEAFQTNPRLKDMEA